MVNALAAKGHNITILSPDVNRNPPPGVHYIHMEGIYTGNEFQSYLESIFNHHSAMSPLTEPIDYDYELYKTCEGMKLILWKIWIKIFQISLICNQNFFLVFFKSQGFNQLLNYPEDFPVDLVIHDITPGACLLGFLHKFGNAPLISVTAYAHPTVLSTMIGDHHYYSYIPHYYLPYNTDMNFFQRFYNFIVHLIEHM